MSYKNIVALMEHNTQAIFDVIGKALADANWGQVSAIQALMLERIVKHEGVVKPGDLKRYGFYIGSNPSYNLHRCVAIGLIKLAKTRDDKRSKVIKVLPAGIAVAEVVNAVFARHSEIMPIIGGIPDDRPLEDALKLVNKFLVNDLLYYVDSHSMAASAPALARGKSFPTIFG